MLFINWKKVRNARIHAVLGGEEVKTNKQREETLTLYPDVKKKYI